VRSGGGDWLVGGSCRVRFSIAIRPSGGTGKRISYLGAPPTVFQNSHRRPRRFYARCCCGLWLKFFFCLFRWAAFGAAHYGGFSAFANLRVASLGRFVSFRGPLRSLQKNNQLGRRGGKNGLFEGRINFVFGYLSRPFSCGGGSAYSANRQKNQGGHGFVVQMENWESIFVTLTGWGDGDLLGQLSPNQVGVGFANRGGGRHGKTAKAFRKSLFVFRRSLDLRVPHLKTRSEVID